MKQTKIKIWLPSVKKIFWKLYWVRRWDEYVFVGGTKYINGKKV